MPAPRDLLAAADLGTRWVVRYDIDDAAFAATDALGELMDRSADSVTIRTRSAGDVVVPLARVTAAKPVPPPPPRR